MGTLSLKDTDWRLRTTRASYVTAPWARGEGYASESVLAVAQWLFHDQKFERLELRTAADNAAAQQVAQKLGCISEGVLRNAWICPEPDRGRRVGGDPHRPDRLEPAARGPGRASRAAGRRRRLPVPRLEMTGRPAARR